MRSSLLTQPRSALWWESLKLLSSSHTWTLHLLTQHTHNCWDFSCWWTHSIISVPSEDVELVITGRPAQTCRYCFYSVVQKWFFCPAEVTRCPDKGEIWHGERPVPNFTFIGAKVWEYSPQNCQNFVFGRKFAPQFCSIFTKFSAFVCVYR